MRLIVGDTQLRRKLAETVNIAFPVVAHKLAVAFRVGRGTEVKIYNAETAVIAKTYRLLKGRPAALALSGKNTG